MEDPERYFNDCCWGGDVVSDQLVPAVSERYGPVQANQEDWGWFLWFREGKVRLAIDIFCDDPGAGRFRIHLTARRRRLLLPDRVADTPELEGLRELVVGRLGAWLGEAPEVHRLDGEFMPAAPG